MPCAAPVTTRPCPRTSCSCPDAHAGSAIGLGLEVLLEAGHAHLPADAGLLVAAERRVGAEPDAAVDARWCRCGSGAATAWARSRSPESTEPERPYGESLAMPDRVVVAVVRDHDEHRAEDLLLREPRGVVEARRRRSARSRSPSWSIDVGRRWRRCRPPPRPSRGSASTRSRWAPRDHRAADRRRGRSGPSAPIDAIVAAATCTASSYRSRGTSSRVVMRAALAGVDARGERRRAGGRGEVGVVEHDRGGLAAELEEHLLQRRRRGGHDRPARSRSSR